MLERSYRREGVGLLVKRSFDLERSLEGSLHSDLVEKFDFSFRPTEDTGRELLGVSSIFTSDSFYTFEE